MTREKQEFEYYCLDRMKLLDNDIPLAYNDDGLIRKFYYKIGLIANIKHRPCYVLYLEDDFDNLTYVSCEFLDNHREDLLLHVQDKDSLFEQLKIIQTMNIFQFASMLNFLYIYEEFKDIIDYNWETLNMNSLIEL